MPVRNLDIGDLSRWIPGEERTNAWGAHWRHERTLPPAVDLDRALAGAFAPAEREELERAGPPAPEDVLFLDLETCGFAGTPLFLCGVLTVRAGVVRVVQWLARSYVEEASVVAEAARAVEHHSLLVTFNGKAYDVPFLRDRAHRHGVTPPAPRAHLDLLHVARRRWRGVLPDCRLTTLETRLTGRRRAGDVPGREIPDRFHAFVKSGDPGPLVPVLRHNLLDLLTLAEILASAAVMPPPGLTIASVQG